jgi:arylsulfatase
MRRAALVVLLVFAACRPGRDAAPAATPSAASGTGHNVVLITIDTLRADHLGLYGYRRNTSPRLDAFAREAAVFTSAYTYWPKTRASMIMMLTGRRPSQNGYGKTHPVLLDFNATLASVLKAAGYQTAALVDNANVAAQYGYAKGFDSYRETWQEPGLKSEAERAHAITEGALSVVRAAAAGRPYFLWLHYVNPHAPYAPPAPFDSMFQDGDAGRGPVIPVTRGYRGGVHEHLAVSGRDRLGYYVAQYDGEIAAADQEVGRVLDALRESGQLSRTVVMVTSDHGESLGEHQYYFDHGEDLFDPSLRVPLLIAAPGAKPGLRSDSFASTLDVLPTLLDAVKVSYPPELAGHSLYPALFGGHAPPRERLFAQNDLNLRGTFDRRFKLVATPVAENDQWGLYDRHADPLETRNVRQQRLDDFRVQRRELDLYFERMEREWASTRRLVAGKPGEGRMTPEACEQLRALGYVQHCG